MEKSSLKNFAIDLLFYIAGSVIYSIAIPMFIAPAHISPGGFTGVALISCAHRSDNSLTQHSSYNNFL